MPRTFVLTVAFFVCGFVAAAALADMFAYLSTGQYVFLFLVIAIPVIAAWVGALLDCLSNESSTGNDKVAWVLVIILLGVLGALLYHFVRRPQRQRELGK